ncbi:uncharacterized protein LY79DRAFT_605336 [Colletotrichum navitas]|uniref:Uncharacterized protein n=1 Tax=Colletotrichum navitas TaxID=681940 RepID=A0AAD8Q1I8_9PEZI|nr:uncharacterized protein LY79DRAFT_605336 [Colletotrichum navitas]KAK1593785.1 hypothetical protein LY79DRAFT_605336 [Colletotrichum navitas]
MDTTSDQAVQALLQYDEHWYQNNSREYPEHGLDDDDDDDEKNSNGVTDEILANATRSHDNSIQHNASQRPGRQHASLHVPPPPAKLANQGTWEFIEFVPAWTDPLWDGHDTVVVDEDLGHLVRKKGLLNRLRPAQLPQDRSQNPTAFALRFGIHPDRTDGRSRLSPTRSTFRRFRVDSVDSIDVKGEYIARQAEKYASNAGVDDVDALLEKYSQITTTGGAKQPSETKKFVLLAMQNMQDDEDWQSLVLGGVTTQELLDDGILSLKNTFGCNLENSLHRLLQRSKWNTATWRGDEPENPRLVYQAGNFKGEWDPITNDDLWRRMQPALRAASRILTFLEHHDPYWARLMDVFNRVRVASNRDPRPPHRRRTYSAWNFRLQNDTSSITVADDHVRAAVDAIGATWRTLDSCMQFELGSAFGSSSDGDTLAGSTTAEGDKIVVKLSVDAMWPLMVDGYSQDEKIMSQFSLAATIIHEIAHAVNYAHMHWLHTPGPTAELIPELQARPDLKQALSDIGVSLFGSKTLKNRNPIEPYFENEQKSELGHSTENHIFGGSNWQAICQSNMPMKHLHFLPSGSLMMRWPTGFKYDNDRMQTWSEIRENPADMVLRTPPMPADTYRLPVKVVDIARFFSEGFWRSEVQKFGSAALRLGTTHPTRVRFVMDELPLASLQNNTTDLGKMMVALWPDKEKLQRAGAIVWEFLERLLGEYFRYHSVHFRWQKDHENLFSRLEEIELTVKQLDISIMEAEILSNLLWYTSPNRKKEDIAERCDSWKAVTLQRYRALVQKLRSSCARIPFTLPRGSERLQDDNTFWDRIGEVGTYARQRFDDLFRKMYDRLSFEIDCVHELYLDIYQLSPEERERSKQRRVVDQLANRLVVLAKQCNNALVCYKGISRLKASFDVKPRFAQSFMVLIEKIRELIPWARDVREINPNNFQRLQPMIPNIRKAKRPASMRIVKFAQKEIDLMPVACLAEIQPFLLFVRDKLKAAENIRIDLVRDQREHLEAIVAQMKASHAPRSVDEDSDEDNDPLTRIIRKRKNAKDDLPSRKHVLKRRRIYTAQLAPAELEHPRPLSKPTGPKPRRPSRDTKASKISPSVADPDLQPRLANPFAAFPSFAFPLAKPEKPDLFSCPRPQPPPPIVNAFPNLTPRGPQTMGIFPHPGALSASFTEDLLAERDMRDALAARSATPTPTPVSPLAFRRREGFQDVPRDPAPLIPNSPESDQNGRYRIPDPGTYSPPGVLGSSPPQRLGGTSTHGIGLLNRRVGGSPETTTAFVDGSPNQQHQGTHNESSVLLAMPRDQAVPQGTSAMSRGRDIPAQRMGWRPGQGPNRGFLTRPDLGDSLMSNPGIIDTDGDHDMSDFH